MVPMHWLVCFAWLLIFTVCWTVKAVDDGQCPMAFGDGGSSLIDDLTAEQWWSWNEHGYIYLKGFYDMKTINKLRHALDAAWIHKEDPQHPVNKLSFDVLVGKQFRQPFGNATSENRKAPYKLNDLYLLSEVVRESVIGGKLSTILETLLDAQPVICNSLSFEYGSQQPDHFDTWYMPSRVMHGMVASWVAMDEVTDANGALRYYPGSHKIKPFIMNPEEKLPSRRIMTGPSPQRLPEFNEYIRKELKAHGMETPLVLHAKPGDVFIWHSQLFHGGMPIKDNYATTRRALVTHYHSTKDYEKNSHSLVPVPSGRGFYRKKVLK